MNSSGIHNPTSPPLAKTGIAMLTLSSSLVFAKLISAQIKAKRTFIHDWTFSKFTAHENLIIKHTLSEFEMMLIRWSKGQLETLMDESIILRKFSSTNLQE